MNKKIDFLAVGDIAVDNFIKISDVEEKCDMSGHCQLCFRFSEKIPYDMSETCYATGNSANVAVSFAKLGFKTFLVSYVGKDSNGKESIKYLKKNKVNTNFIKVVKDFKTNYHYILWHDAERTILVNHTKFPYSLPHGLPKPRWVYLSSLASNSEKYHEEILNYLKSNPDIKLAFQPGTFQIKLGKEKLKEFYKISELLICNKEEAEKILSINENDYKKLLAALYELGPKLVVVTDGMNGSFSYDGKDFWHMKPFDNKAYERTGAGDAFSSALVAALSLDKGIEEAMMWGSANAMSVVLKVGPQAGLMTRSEIEKYINEFGENNKPVKI